MLHIGMDLSRRRIDGHVIGDGGVSVDVFVVSPDRDALLGLPAMFGTDVRAVVESMNGARFVHDVLSEAGWEVHVADAVLVKAMAPLTAKTDRIDARVLADLSYRDLIPSIWLPRLGVRAGRERARHRVSLVQQRVGLKNRIHATLMTFGIPNPVSDLFGVAGREMLDRLEVPDPWQSHIQQQLAHIDYLDRVIYDHDQVLYRCAATDPATQLLVTAPGIGPVLGYTIAQEIGDITRFATPDKLVGYTGLVPSVHQSGTSDRRGPLTRRGPRLLRWALIEATTHAQRHRVYRQRHQRIRHARNAKIARVDTARRLTKHIWAMLTHHQEFSPRGDTPLLVA